MGGGQSSVAAAWQTVGTLTAAEAATELRTVADTLSVLHARQALLSLLLHCQAEATAAAEAATDSTDSSCVSSGAKALAFCASTGSTTAASTGSVATSVSASATAVVAAAAAAGAVSVSGSSARMAQQVAALLRLLLFRGWSCEQLPDATTALSDFSSSDDLRAIPALLSPVVCSMLQLPGDQSSALQVGCTDSL
jgi:hypothetical protein